MRCHKNCAGREGQSMKCADKNSLDEREKKKVKKEAGGKEKKYQMVEDENSVYEYDLNCMCKRKENV